MIVDNVHALGPECMHQDLGPGLLETVYEATLAATVRKRGLSVECQLPFRSNRKGTGWMCSFEPN